jgi:Tfp pilus assembly major pilin PilA
MKSLIVLVAVGAALIPVGASARPADVSAYTLTDLSAVLPAGYSNLTPLAINSAGEVAGDVLANASKTSAGPRFGPGVAARSASSSPPMRVFTYADGAITILPLRQSDVSAWFGGLNSQGAVALTTCTSTTCKAWVVRPTKNGGITWTGLPSANAADQGLGGIADNGDVTGTVMRKGWDVGAVWKATAAGTYSSPVILDGLKKSHFQRAYVPDAISSTLGQDVEGGAMNTPAFYPDSQPVLWATKMGFDRAFIGSHTLALGGSGQLLFAAVGCELPVPACGPACPVDPVIWTVVVGTNGKPVAGNGVTLDAPRAPHCGVSPFAVVAGADNQPMTVGQTALTIKNKWVPRAVMWHASSITILNRAIVRAKGTNLQSANAINTSGVIVGTGRCAGEPHQGWLLTPSS